MKLKTKHEIQIELEECYVERKRKIKDGLNTDKIDGYILALEWVLYGLSLPK